MARTALARLVLVSLFALSASAMALEESTVAISFAVGWRSISTPENFVQLGVVYRCHDRWCAVTETFPGGMNLRRRTLSPRHAMVTPYRRPDCVDEHLTAVEGIRSGELEASVEESASQLRIRLGPHIYSWAVDRTTSGAYRLAKLNEQLADNSSDQAVGYAFEGTTPASAIDRFEQIDGFYDGELDHKDSMARVSADWQHSLTSLDFRKFGPWTERGVVKGLSQPGHPEVLKRMRIPVWAHHSIALVSSRNRWLKYLSHEYGHDFNANGCFDEFGHNKLMLPIVDGTDIRAWVFVEYTPDSQDQIPMLSVGRYLRRK